MKDEATYNCDSCGEKVVVPLPDGRITPGVRRGLPGLLLPERHSRRD
jgi:hypothetical protein